MIPGHEHDFEPVVPFVVVESKGGPYDDQSFVAGYAMGEIDAKLAVANSLGLPRVDLPIVRRALLPQLELHGMRYDYPVLIDISGPPNDPEEWCAVALTRGGGS